MKPRVGWSGDTTPVPTEQRTVLSRKGPSRLFWYTSCPSQGVLTETLPDVRGRKISGGDRQDKMSGTGALCRLNNKNMYQNEVR